MKKADEKKYEEWLTMIVNTRLMFNTVRELEEVLDAYSIHNNGIKRCFPTPQKMRAAFRNLQVEVKHQTASDSELEYILEEYQRTWDFYKLHFARRSNPNDIALKLLAYCYPPYRREGLPPRLKALFAEVVRKEMEPSFLLLMLLKVLPGCHSKEGDVTDMPRLFETVLSFLKSFTTQGRMTDELPVFKDARQIANKSRLTLLYCTYNILNTYKTMNSKDDLYQSSLLIRNNTGDWPLEGYWNECGGTANSTVFWEFVSTKDKGIYFLIKWHKKADGKLTYLRYTVALLSEPGEDYTLYMMHPKFIANRMKDLPFQDDEHVWYHAAYTKEGPSAHLSLRRSFESLYWPLQLELTKVTDRKVLRLYECWMTKECTTVPLYPNWEYDFSVRLYAITQTHLYILSMDETGFYKIPKDRFEHFDKIKITDNVGIITVDNQEYLAFDEFMMYIRIQEKELQKYGIEWVDKIE